MSETLAARMRAAYVGEDAIAFDELKPEVRERWERVAAVAKTKPPVTREAIARALEDRWCLPGVPTPEDEADVVLAVLADCGEDDDTNIAMCPQCYRAHDPAPIRVPFSDAQIEAMAKACADTWHREQDWYQGFDNVGKQQWRDSIRAALAAGGLEPCAVPEYRPQDVALNARIARATSRDLREIAIHAYLSHEQAKRENAGCMVDPMGAAVEAIRDALSTDNGLVDHLQGELKAATERISRVSAKSNRRRVALKALNRTVAGQSDLIQRFLRTGKEPVPLVNAAAPERASDEELAKAGWDAVRLRRGNCDETWENTTPGTRGWYYDASAAVRARVEAPLLAEIAELRAGMERQREAIRDREKGELEACAEIDTLRAELDPAKPGSEYTAKTIVHRVYSCPTRAEAEEKFVELTKATNGRSIALDFRDWLLPLLPAERPEGMPARDDMAKWIYQLWTGNCGIRPDWDSWGNKHFFVKQADGLLEVLAPWIREPTGWELDVTAQVMAQEYAKHESKSPLLSMEHVRELVISRIRPTFGACKECEKLKLRLEDSQRMEDKRLEVMHRYEQDIKKAHAVLSAALEGE